MTIQSLSLSEPSARRRPEVPRRAMVLAAGFGTRLRPLTDTVPKPLIDVAGQAMIDHVFDRLSAYGIERVVVNAHYRADDLARHLARRERPQTVVVREAELLGAAGGVRGALDPLGEEPFFVVNADALWLNGPQPALDRLACAWNGAAMDGLLLLVPTVKAIGVDGFGDFHLHRDGTVEPAREGQMAAYHYGGVQILEPGRVSALPPGPASMARIWNPLLAEGRLHGIVHDGVWFHAGGPDGLAEAREALRQDNRRWIDP